MRKWLINLPLFVPTEAREELERTMEHFEREYGGHGYVTAIWKQRELQGEVHKEKSTGKWPYVGTDGDTSWGSAADNVRRINNE